MSREFRPRLPFPWRTVSVVVYFRHNHNIIDQNSLCSEAQPACELINLTGLDAFRGIELNCSTENRRRLRTLKTTGEGSPWLIPILVKRKVILTCQRRAISKDYAPGLINMANRFVGQQIQQIPGGTAPARVSHHQPEGRVIVLAM